MSKQSVQQKLFKGQHMITLREARCNALMSTKDAAAAVGITERTLKKWEIDCGMATGVVVGHLCKVYGMSSLNHIYLGKEADLYGARRLKEAQRGNSTGPIPVEDIISALKVMGKDTSELEAFCEEIRRSREVGANAGN